MTIDELLSARSLGYQKWSEIACQFMGTLRDHIVTLENEAVARERRLAALEAKQAAASEAGSAEEMPQLHESAKPTADAVEWLRKAIVEYTGQNLATTQEAFSAWFVRHTPHPDTLKVRELEARLADSLGGSVKEFDLLLASERSANQAKRRAEEERDALRRQLAALRAAIAAAEQLNADG